MRFAALLILLCAAGSAFAADRPFKVLSTGKVGGQLEASVTEARNRKELTQLWSRLGLKGAAPKVNFKQQMVVAWVGGGSACDKFTLTRAQEEIDTVVLEIDHVRPPPGHMCIMIFSPSAIVASIPMTSKGVRVDVKNGGSAPGDAIR